MHILDGVDELFEFFTTKPCKAFGMQMARYFVEQTGKKLTMSDKKANAQSLRAMKKMEIQIEEFRKKNALNFYKIAQAGNAFKWELRDAGCDDVQADTLTKWFVIKMKP